MLDGRRGEQALRPLGEDCDRSDDVGPRLEQRERLAVPPPPLVAGAHAEDATVLDEQLRRGGLGEHGHAQRLGLLAEEPAELGDGQDVVAVVPHRRRRRDAEGRPPREDVHGLPGHLSVRRQVRHRQTPLEEAAERAWIDDGAGQEVRPRLLPLLEDGNRDLAQALANLRVLLQELAEPDRAREPAGAAPDDQDADLDSLVAGIRRSGDRIRSAERGREVERARHG